MKELNPIEKSSHRKNELVANVSALLSADEHKNAASFEVCPFVLFVGLLRIDRCLIELLYRLRTVQQYSECRNLLCSLVASKIYYGELFFSLPERPTKFGSHLHHHQALAIEMKCLH